jgi:hypothetical protein
MEDKYPYCETCLNRGEFFCDECDDGDAYEPDESQLVLGEDGFWRWTGLCKLEITA